MVVHAVRFGHGIFQEVRPRAVSGPCLLRGQFSHKCGGCVFTSSKGCSSGLSGHDFPAGWLVQAGSSVLESDRSDFCMYRHGLVWQIGNEDCTMVPKGHMDGSTRSALPGHGHQVIEKPHPIVGSGIKLLPGNKLSCIPRCKSWCSCQTPVWRVVAGGKAPSHQCVLVKGCLTG